MTEKNTTGKQNLATGPDYLRLVTFVKSFVSVPFC